MVTRSRSTSRRNESMLGGEEADADDLTAGEEVFVRGEVSLKI